MIPDRFGQLLIDKKEEFQNKIQQLSNIKCIYLNAFDKTTVLEECSYLLPLQEEIFCKEKCEFYQNQLQNLLNEKNSIVEAIELLIKTSAKDYSLS